jgi:Neprosin
VGYWPRSLFHSLRDTSDLIQWGGEVFDVREGDAQTKTHMGSGALATSGFGKAAYQRNLQYVSLGNTMYDVTDLQV